MTLTANIIMLTKLRMRMKGQEVTTKGHSCQTACATCDPTCSCHIN